MNVILNWMYVFCGIIVMFGNYNVIICILIGKKIWKKFR